MRIDGVVEQGPRDSRQVQRHRWPSHGTAMRRPGQKGAPVESQPQEHLRPPRKPFGKRIDCHGQQGQDAHGDCRLIEAEKDAKRQNALQDHPRRGLPDTDLTRRNRARASAFDLPVEFPVRDVIPGATGAPHQKGPNCASHGDPKIFPTWLTVVQDRQRQPPPTGNQQQPCPDGPVRAAEAQIGAGKGRGTGVDPVATDGISDLTIWCWGIALHM